MSEPERPLSQSTQPCPRCGLLYQPWQFFECATCHWKLCISCLTAEGTNDDRRWLCYDCRAQKDAIEFGNQRPAPMSRERLAYIRMRDEESLPGLAASAERDRHELLAEYDRLADEIEQLQGEHDRQRDTILRLILSNNAALEIVRAVAEGSIFCMCNTIPYPLPPGQAFTMEIDWDHPLPHKPDCKVSKARALLAALEQDSGGKAGEG